MLIDNPAKERDTDATDAEVRPPRRDCCSPRTGVDSHPRLKVGGAAAVRVCQRWPDWPRGRGQEGTKLGLFTLEYRAHCKFVLLLSSVL